MTKTSVIRTQREINVTVILAFSFNLVWDTTPFIVLTTFSKEYSLFN